MRILERTDGPTALSASYNGTAIHMEHMEGLCVVAAVTGASSLNGAFKIQVSNNAFTDNTNNQENSNAVWVDYSGSSQAVTADGNISWNIYVLYAKAARVVYTRTGGTASVTMYIAAKGPQS